MSANNNDNRSGNPTRHRRNNLPKPAVDEEPTLSATRLAEWLDPSNTPALLNGAVDAYIPQLSIDDIMQSGSALVENAVETAWTNAANMLSPSNLFKPSNTPTVARNPTPTRPGGSRNT